MQVERGGKVKVFGWKLCRLVADGWVTRDEEVNFVESRNSQENQSGFGAPDAYAAPAYSSPAQTNAPKFEEIKTDDDLPFW